MSWEHWLNAVRTRLDRYESTGDPELVLGREAREEAVKLVTSLPARGNRVGAVACHALGWLHWYARQAYVDRGESMKAEIELDTALRHLDLAAGYSEAPRTVPAEVADLFARTAHAVRDPLAAFIDVLRLLDEAGQAQESGGTLATLLSALNDAITTTQRLAASADPQIAQTASETLGILFLYRTVVTDDDVDRERGIARLRMAVREASGASRNRAMLWLGAALYERGRRGAGSMADLDEAVALLQRAISAAPNALLTNDYQPLIGDAHYARFLMDRDPAVLAAAIAAMRVAVDGASGSQRASNLAALSTMLRARFEHSGDSESLDEAAETARQAVDLAAPARHAPVLALARVLLVKYSHYGNTPLLFSAIEMLRNQLAAAPSAAGDEVTRASLYAASPHDLAGDLGAALLLYHRLGAELLGDDADITVLDEAIALLRQASTDTTGKRGGTDLINLGAALAERHKLAPDSAALDEAVAVYRRAAAMTTSNNHLEALHNLASGLAERATAAGETVPDEAIALVRTIAQAAEAAPADRVANARRWAQWAASVGARDEAVTAYRLAIGLLPELVPRHLRRSDQQRLLSGQFTMVSDAAAAALDAGRPQTALELLEHGRGVLLSAALDFDRDLADLRSVAPQLADTLEQVRLSLTGPATADQRHELIARERQVLADIRQLPGLPQFARPPTEAHLRLAAKSGPVVTVNVNASRCDAIILHSGGSTAIPLPDLSSHEVTTRGAEFVRALARAEYHAASLVDRLAAQDTIRQTLEYLWDTVAFPVLGELGHRATPDDDQPWPRVWWSPTGPLTALPLHAAGYHKDGRTVLDRVVSSYTPTIRALAHLHTVLGQMNPQPDPPSRSGQALIVAMPQTPGHAPLPATLAEAEALATEYGVPALVGTQASRRNVLDALPSCNWAHFACHAYADNANPSGGHLLLYDQALTISDIQRIRVPQANLAYLSACSTARSSEALVGESIHPGAAFQTAGFRHVVATLWQVNDRAAADLARDFYTRRETHGIAAALHAATRLARDREPRLPSRWAAHIHLGP